MKITLNVKLKDSKVKDFLEIYDDTLIKVTDEKNRVVYKGIVDYAPKDIRDGRWHKGANNKTFTINTERGALTVKVLDSSVKDSIVKDSSFDEAIKYSKDLKNLDTRSDEQTIRSLIMKGESIAKQVERSIEGLSREFKSRLQTVRKENEKNITEHIENRYFKTHRAVISVQTALEGIMHFFGQEIKRVLTKYSNGWPVGERFPGKTDKYLAVAKRLASRFREIYSKFDSLIKEAKNSIIKDSLLKTYKIKNHDSGKTYKVKAASYSDAKDIYNKYILKDSFTEDEEMIKTPRGQFRLSSKSYKELKEEGWSLHHSHKINGKEYYIMGKDNKAIACLKDAIEDSLTEDAETVFTVSIKFASDKPRTRGINKGYTGGSYGGGEFNINQTIGDIITNFYNIMKKDFDDAESANIRVEKLSITPYTRGNRHSLRQSVNIREVEGKAVQNAIQIGNSIKLSKYAKDSLTEDALSKFVQSYLSTKKVSSKAEQDEIIKFLLERNKITTEDIPKVRSLLKIVKDALTEDALYVGYSFTNPKDGILYTVVEFKPNSKGMFNALLKSKSGKYCVTNDLRHTSQGTSFNKKTDIHPSVNMQARIERVSKTSNTNWGEELRAAWPKIADSLTEDADIAQNDIKETFLPEDANADNIKYIGFNELRKISFYEYEGEYFAHHDLTGQTEKVDKDQVQKILKKNLLGEIDENEDKSNTDEEV